MALPPYSEFRGVVAAMSQPATDEDVLNRFSPIFTGLTLYNTNNIQYRNPAEDQVVLELVYRWDTRPFREIFLTGFTPQPRSSNQTLASYYNLEQYVNSGGSPADASNAHSSAFVSTTRSTSWRPVVRYTGTIYRYQISAPGAVDAVRTLGSQNLYPNQAEISFAGGINRQYIRMARGYSVTVTPGSQYPTFARLDNRLYRNGLFNPNPTSTGYTSQEFMNRLRNPTCPTRDQETLINIVYAPERSFNLTGEAGSDSVIEESNYVDSICGVGRYIGCAFNKADAEEAYLFIANKYLHINYAPGTTNDFIIKGPDNIITGFSFLRDTIFEEGIDAAFTSSRRYEAYIFRSDIYALINFADGNIIQGPKKITDSFPSLKIPVFQDGIDAAFASSRTNEAYIFRGNEYALINFAPGTTNDYIIQGPKKITDSFHSLKGTIFEDGIDAAFTSTRKNEAYIFKGDTYALINYAPGTTNDYIIQNKKIIESFHSLKEIIPMYPCGC